MSDCLEIPEVEIRDRVHEFSEFFQESDELHPRLVESEKALELNYGDKWIYIPHAEYVRREEMKARRAAALN